MKRFRLNYLNQADTSDPRNELRVLCVVLWPWYVRFTWGWPKIRLRYFQYQRGHAADRGYSAP
jgi:hypothetical protein